MKLLNKVFMLILIFTLINFQKSFPMNDEQTKKYVYLTFDDGPTCKNTPLLLDKLKELNLPATFFVVGKLVNENPEVLKRIVEENHSIGLHTMSHNKNKCYSSHENFIKENLELQKLLQKDFNVNTKIVRFPFGSQNSYLKMDKIFLDKLHKNNFKIYDWHIDTLDAINPKNSPETILQICKNQYKKRFENNKNLIILMHTNSNNINTINSLKLIKDYFLDLGYEFNTLNENTKELFYIK